jgi:hypothetical protein
VVGPAFSPFSRDPNLHRLADIDDFFLRAHEEGIPAELRVRVVARDARTNRQALLWESGKAHKLGVMDPSPYWQV